MEAVCLLYCILGICEAPTAKGENPEGRRKSSDDSGQRWMNNYQPKYDLEEEEEEEGFVDKCGACLADRENY